MHPDASRARRAPLLVIGIGNPSRGDDALGPLFVEHAATILRSEVSEGRIELWTDFQLQIEHALDIDGRDRVVFVDADAGAGPAPFRLERVHARPDATGASHALSPEALLDAHRVLAREPPEAWLLAIRGDRFELGERLSEAAEARLGAALQFFVSEVRSGRTWGVGARK